MGASSTAAVSKSYCLEESYMTYDKSLHWPPGRICHTSCSAIILALDEVRQLLGASELIR